MANIICDGLELFGSEHLEELMNMYLVSKGIRSVYLMDTTERDHIHDYDIGGHEGDRRCQFREWSVKNAWVYNLYSIESRAKDNIFFINTLDYSDCDKIRSKIYRRKSMGQMLEYYSPTGKLTHDYHYRLAIYFRYDFSEAIQRDIDTTRDPALQEYVSWFRKRRYILFNQLSNSEFPDTYIRELLDRFNSIYAETGYYFTAEIDNNSKMFMCDCENCVN